MIITSTVTYIVAPVFFNIQLFAEGGAGDGAGTGDGTGTATGVTSADAGQNTGAKGNLSNVIYGVQDDTAAAGQEVNTDERAAKFKAMIKGEYKDLYDAEVQGIIGRRLKGTEAKVQAYEKIMPVLDRLNAKYGLKDGDYDGLVSAVDEDESLWEDEALERGMSVSDLKQVKKMERENAQLKQQMEEQRSRENADKAFQQLIEQEKQVKQIYPDFNLKAEIDNPAFKQLILANIPLQTAYEVVHKDEVITAGMRFAAKSVEQKVTNSIAAGTRRPAESGLSNQSSVIVKSDVSKLTKADRAEINRRVARGERIRF